MAVSSQVVTALVSLVVGAGGSFAFSEVGDRWRSGRERARHWEDERAAAYTRFAIATKSMMTICFRVGADRGVDSITEPLKLDDPATKQMLGDAITEREAAFEFLLLISDDDVVAEARLWVDRVYALRTLLEEPELTREQWVSAVAAANKHRDEFHRLARPHLGIVVNEPRRRRRLRGQ